MKKPTLQNVLAKKLKPEPEAAPPPAAEPSATTYSKRATSLRIEPELLGRLKLLAVQQRKRVNDVILEAIENHLAAHERHAA
jgi:hypothetical protein